MAKKNTTAKLSKDELMKLVSEKREALRALRFSVAGSKNRNVKESATLRKEIARALTALNAQN